MVFAIAGLLLALTTPSQQAAAAVDATGRWEGTLTNQRPDGGSQENSALILLKQKDAVLTGTVGADDSDRHPITNGKIEGNKVTLFATSQNSGAEFRIELTLEGDDLKGTITSGERKGTLALHRVKQ